MSPNDRDQVLSALAAALFTDEVPLFVKPAIDNALELIHSMNAKDVAVLDQFRSAAVQCVSELDSQTQVRLAKVWAWLAEDSEPSRHQIEKSQSAETAADMKQTVPPVPPPPPPEESYDAGTQNADGTLHCEVCQMQMNGPHQWKDHIIGKKHKKNALRAQSLLMAGEGDPSRIGDTSFFDRPSERACKKTQTPEGMQQAPEGRPPKWPQAEPWKGKERGLEAGRAWGMPPWASDRMQYSRLAPWSNAAEPPGTAKILRKTAVFKDVFSWEVSQILEPETDVVIVGDVEECNGFRMVSIQDPPGAVDVGCFQPEHDVPSSFTGDGRPRNPGLLDAPFSLGQDGQDGSYNVLAMTEAIQ